MKKITLFLLLLMGAFTYCQVGSMNIFNFSGYDISFKVTGFDKNTEAQDCQPVIANETYVTLTSGSVVTYDQYNTSHLQNPVISQWYVIADITGSYVQHYNLLSGAPIPVSITNLTKWQFIDIKVSNGENIWLGRNCGTAPNGGIFSGGASVSATWTYSGNDVFVVIT